MSFVLFVWLKLCLQSQNLTQKMLPLLLVLSLLSGTAGRTQSPCTSPLELITATADPLLPLCRSTSEAGTGTAEVWWHNSLSTSAWELMTDAALVPDLESIVYLRLLYEKGKVLKQKNTIVRWVRKRLLELIYGRCTRCIGPLRLAIMVFFVCILRLENEEFRQDVQEMLAEQCSFLKKIWHQHLEKFVTYYLRVANPLILLAITTLCDRYATSGQLLAARTTALLVLLNIHLILHNTVDGRRSCSGIACIPIARSLCCASSGLCSG